MLVQIITENGQKKVIPLTADAGAGLPVGTIIAMYKKSNPSGFLYLDGRDTTGTSEELSTHYPLLYSFLGGTNKLPDLREVGLKGAEKNTTYIFDSTETDPRTGQAGTQNHDVFTQGEFKDDQVQEHYHNIGIDSSLLGYSGSTAERGQNLGAFAIGGVELKTRGESGRKGDVTRGKSFAVYFYIKATSGLSENAQDNVINTLNEERSYSTEEVNTGKKWIDGKPIYSKVLSGTFGVIDGTDWVYMNVSVTDLNIGSVVRMEGFIETSTYTYPIPYIWDNGSTSKMTYHRGQTRIRVASNATGASEKPFYIILEYTKTT